MSSEKWALITGGSRGIGRAVALEIANAGWNVGIVHLRNDYAAAESAAAVRASGRKCLVYRQNVAKQEECSEVVRRFGEQAGQLSGLVHAAGLGALSPALETRPVRWQIAWDTHVGALLNLVAAAQPFFAEAASIVTFTSLGAWRVMPGYATIAAAKGAVESLVRYLAAELSSRHVNVNAVRGGPIDTDSLRSFATFGEVEAESRRRAPGRLGRPEDLAPIAAFLLGSGARWINGQVITADGGFGLH